MRTRIERLAVLGMMLVFFGLLFYADAIGSGRAYGYTTGNTAEFVVGTVAVVFGSASLYLAGMTQKRMNLACSYRNGRRLHSAGHMTVWRQGF